MTVELKVFAITLATLFAQCPAMAQEQSQKQTASQVLARAAAQSSEMEQLKQNLRSPDTSTRIATFTAMVESGDPGMRELAISEGFASVDTTMKALAFRAGAIDVTTIQLEPVGLPADQIYTNYQRYAPIRLSFENYNWRTGTFCHYDDCADSGFVAQINGRTISFKGSKCSGSLSNVEGTWEFEGLVNCFYQTDRRDLMSGQFRLKLR